jgi:hypothetical protein
MKKFVWFILVLAAMAACQKVEDNGTTEEPKMVEEAYTLTMEASKGADTKALSLNSSTLNAYWKTGETVAVYLGGTYLGQLAATADGTDATKAMLSGVLDSVTGVAQNSVLTLLFPRKDWDYTGQNGSAPNEAGPLATQYDYATASVTVASVNTGNKTIAVTSGAHFVNQQSVYRFSFKVGGMPLSVKELTVSSDHNKLVTFRSYSGGWTSTYGNLTVTPESATDSFLYLSLRNENTNPTEADRFSFVIIGENNALYLGNKDIPGDKLGDGRFVSAQNISVTKSNLAQSGSATEVW